MKSQLNWKQKTKTCIKCYLIKKVLAFILPWASYNVSIVQTCNTPNWLSRKGDCLSTFSSWHKGEKQSSVWHNPKFNLIYLILTLCISALLTKCEVKMAGYWPSSFSYYLCTKTKSRSIKKNKKTRSWCVSCTIKPWESFMISLFWLFWLLPLFCNCNCWHRLKTTTPGNLLLAQVYMYGGQTWAGKISPSVCSGSQANTG